MIRWCVQFAVLAGAIVAVAIAQQDFSQVEIKPTKVAGNVYMLEGSGGNIGVTVGEDGVLMIDDQYAPLAEKEYVRIAADLIERTPWEVVYHRVTGTAAPDILLAPAWCAKKWDVLNGIADELTRRGSRQGSRAGPIWKEQSHAA